MMRNGSLIGGVLGSAFAGVAMGQSFTIPWHTIDGGGGPSSGGAFTLSGTIGQHDAGGPMTGGGFSPSGGFWAGEVGDPCIGDFNGDGTDDLLRVQSPEMSVLYGLKGPWLPFGTTE